MSAQVPSHPSAGILKPSKYALGDVTNLSNKKTTNLKDPKSSTVAKLVVDETAPPIVSPEPSPALENGPPLIESPSTEQLTASIAEQKGAFAKLDDVCYTDPYGRKKPARILDVKFDEADTPLYMVMIVPDSGFVLDVKEKDLSPSNDSRLVPGTMAKSLFWDSVEALKLFCPKRGENVFEAIDAKIAILDKAIVEGRNGWRTIVKGGLESGDLFTYADRDKIRNKVLYLSVALKKVKTKMPKMTWEQCCKEVIDDIAKCDHKYYRSPANLMQMYVKFRKNRNIPAPAHVEKVLESIPIGLNRIFGEEEED